MALVADIFNVLLIDDDGEVIATTTLTEANIDVSVQENDVRAGRSNELIAILRSDRDISISLTDAEFKYEFLAKQLGQDIKTGEGVAYAMPKWYTVEDKSGKLEITLDKAPTTTDNGLKMYDAQGKPVTGTLSGSKVTFVAPVKAGDAIEVRTYKYNTAAQTETISIDNSVFPIGLKCVLETIEIERDETPLNILQYQFDEAIPTGNFTISTQSQRTAQAQAFNLRIIKPRHSNEVGRVLRIPIA